MGWRSLVLPTLGYVLGVATQTTFVFFLAPAYARAHDLGSLELFAFAGSAIATMLVGIPAGRLSDKVPRRRAMRLGWSMEAGAAAWLVFAPPSTLTLVLAAAGIGGGLGFGYTAFQSYVADVIAAGSLANGYGLTSAFAFLGSAAGPLLGAVTLGTLGSGADGVRVLAAMLAAGAAIGALATLALPTMRRQETVRGVPATAGFLAAVVQSFDPRPRLTPLRANAAEDERRSIRAYAVVFALLGFGYGATAPWFGPRLLDAFAMPTASWGALLGWSTALAAIGIYFAGVVGRRVENTLRFALTTNLLTAAMLVGFALAPGIGVAAVFFLGRQLFGNMTGPVLSTGLMLEVSEETRGESFGMMNVAWNLPWALGAAVGGLLLAGFGAWLFVLGAAFLAVGPLAGLALRGAWAPAEARARARRRGRRANV